MTDAIQPDDEGRVIPVKRGLVEPPPPADDAFAALEARARLKLEAGERLTAEERAIFARLPGDKDVRYQ